MLTSLDRHSGIFPSSTVLPRPTFLVPIAPPSPPMALQNIWTYAQALSRISVSINRKTRRRRRKRRRYALERKRSETKRKMMRWDINPPGLVSQFWIENPHIALHMMIHYVISGKEVPIPYRWHPSTFTYCNIYQPQVPKPEENYVALTMFDHIDMCREWI